MIDANHLSPKAILDIMQYKRWMVRTGLVGEFLKDKECSLMGMNIENEMKLDDDTKLNDDLIA